MGADAEDGRRVVLGRIAGPHGVRGWLRVQPFTEAPGTLLGFRRWLVGRGAQWQVYALEEGHEHGSGLLVRLAEIADRDAAARLRGSDVAVWRTELPALEKDEYYWSDLEGLAVVTAQGVSLGTVERLIATGANDVMVVIGDRERLIPFVMEDVVRRVDLAAGCVEVDWDPEF
jgi:16S rRNA processing protein RimM